MEQGENRPDSRPGRVAFLVSAPPVLQDLGCEQRCRLVEGLCQLLLPDIVEKLIVRQHEAALRLLPDRSWQSGRSRQHRLLSVR